MRRRFGSVRARTTLGATVVVALALFAAAVPVILALRADLLGGVAGRAQEAAQRVAAQWAAGVPAAELRLPEDDQPVQVVGADGRVLAQTPGLMLSPLPAASPEPTDDDPPEPDRVGDDPVPAAGMDDDRADDDGRGDVSSDVDFLTRTAVYDGDTGEYRFAAVTATSPGGDPAVVYAGAELESAREALATTVRGLLLGLPLVLVVVAAATWLVTRRALRPVEAIRTELAGITAAGDLARRVPVPASRDEIARLAVTTNRTLSALQRSTEQQRRFVADASHELRNPIASLRAQLEIAVEHPDLLDLEGTVEDVHRLQQLASDLLLLARLDAGAGQVAPVPVDLASLVEEVLAGRPANGRPPVDFTARAAPTVRGHPRRLARALDNLLDNAQRHAAGRVAVTLAQEPGRAVLSVADDGPGVPPEDREAIFGRFVRRDDARSRDEGGAGLGLALAREIAESDGGTLVCADPGGPGALFELRLPLP